MGNLLGMTPKVVVNLRVIPSIFRRRRHTSSEKGGNVGMRIVPVMTFIKS